MQRRNETDVSPHKPELVFTRILQAPIELVYEAWTDRNQVAQWWGPNGFTSQIRTWELRPGGTIHLLMSGPNGEDHPMTGEFLEVVYPEKLVFISKAIESSPGEWQLEVKNTLTLREENGQTILTLRTQVIKAGEQAGSALQGMEAGWSQTLDRLENRIHAPRSKTTVAIAGENPGDREIVSTRQFNASREFVFSLWEDPEHLAVWWGPVGFTTTTSRFEFKPGGTWEFIMHGPDGVDYRNKIRFTDIARPEKICYEHVTGPVFKVIVLFEDLGEKSRLHFRMIFESAELRKKVIDQFGALEGLKQTLGRLEELVDQKGAPTR